MTELLIFIVTAYGASNIMVFSTIFTKFRELVGVNKEEKGFFGKLFGCMMCLPFWWGVILSLTIYSPSFAMNGDEVMMFDLPKVYLCAFLDGCLASGAVWFIHTVQERIEE